MIKPEEPQKIIRNDKKPKESQKNPRNSRELYVKNPKDFQGTLRESITP